jgi:nucleoside-diphosphate-sugar epimerase
MTLKNKKVLVTGATGFIGANITRRLLREGARVNIFIRRDSDKWRLSDRLKSVSSHTADLTDAAAVGRALRRIRPDIIVHAAVYGGYPAQKDVKKIFDLNLMATVNLLNACRETGFRLFLNTGSSSEYGIKNEAMKECDPLEPVTPYGISKAAATLYCRSIALMENLPIATLRLFSPYGYFEGSSRLIPYVILSSLKNDTIELSSGRNVRDFIFVEDVCDAYIKAIERCDYISGEILNVASGREHSVEDVVKEISKLTGVKTRIEWGREHNPRIEPKKWQADISKANRLLGWKPRHSLREGLDKLIGWFGKNMKLYK